VIVAIAVAVLVAYLAVTRRDIQSQAGLDTGPRLSPQMARARSARGD
jgi:hypothetical protein